MLSCYVMTTFLFRYLQFNILIVYWERLQNIIRVLHPIFYIYSVFSSSMKYDNFFGSSYSLICGKDSNLRFWAIPWTDRNCFFGFYKRCDHKGGFKFSFNDFWTCLENDFWTVLGEMLKFISSNSPFNFQSIHGRF